MLSILKYDVVVCRLVFANDFNLGTKLYIPKHHAMTTLYYLCPYFRNHIAYIVLYFSLQGQMISKILTSF